MIYADLAVRGYLDNVSVFYTDGKAINNIKLNETRHWLPASTVKTYAAMYAYKLVSEGKLHLSDIVSIDGKNEVPTELVTDTLPNLLIGETVSIDRLIRQMLIQSDNTAFNQLLDVLGRNTITRYIQSLGLTQSHVGSKLNLDDSQTQYEYDVSGYGVNSTTAEDYAKAFLLIKNNKIPGAKNLFTILSQQKINNMIPLFLPKTVVCAHKTGDLDPLYHDGGICQDKTHSYVLTIFTNAGDPTLLAHLSEIIYTKNYQLVGESLTQNQSVSDNMNQPIDELVMNQPKTSVLGTTTLDTFPIPDITAADLGIKASDLSLVLNSNKLPKVIIPADSPLHTFSDAWQLVKIFIAPGPLARMDVNLQIGQLRLAEAKDLMSRKKIQQAQTIIGSIQSGLGVLSKDPIVKANAAEQTTIQAISETRFSLLGAQLQKAKGNEKITLIKQIASQAKETIQQIQPRIPEAVNATSPTQRPLIGTIVNSTSTEITVKTAGGQEITVPTNNIDVAVKEKSTFSPIPLPSPTPSVTPTTRTLAIGTTIALIGSTVNNHYSPALILTNVPKELAAPQPVTVAKVDTKHNTMVVQENGVYTQVNINKNTTIKGADTNIPLKSIQAGDVVVVHGAPLTQIQIPIHTTTPTITQALSPKPSSTPPSATKQTIISTPIQSGPTPSSSGVTGVQSQTTPIVLHQNQTTPPSAPSPTSSPTKQPNTLPSPTSPSQKITPIIQGTSIQVIEKKSNMPTTSPQNSQPQPVQKAQSQPQSSPPVQTNAIAPAIINDDKKK